MAFTSSTRLVNPRLGTYFGIFAAGFTALVFMALMFEQLGTGDLVVRLVMFAGPLALYAGIALSSSARERHDYFASGRRVPAFFNGLVLGIAALGGAGYLALTGSLFLIGFDALSLSIGWYAGLVFMAVLFAPFVRKFGAYTLPTFLGRRFDSRSVRICAAVLLSAPILLLLLSAACAP
jgi:cation/acetate symporter